jgi:hypothetical protein
MNCSRSGQPSNWVRSRSRIDHQPIMNSPGVNFERRRQDSQRYNAARQAIAWRQA